MLRTIIIAVTLSAPFAIAPALAQTPTAVAQPLSPEVEARLPAARELVTTMRAAEMMKSVLPMIWQQLVQPLMAASDPKAKAAVDSIAPMILSEMEKELPAFGIMIAQVYATQYTDEELTGLTAFMRSPLGQKFLDKQPQLAQASMTAGQQFGQALAIRIRPRIEEELGKRMPR